MLRFFLDFWDFKIRVLVGGLGAKGFPEPRAVLEDEGRASNGPEYGQRVGSDVNVRLEHRHPANIKPNFEILIFYRIIGYYGCNSLPITEKLFHDIDIRDWKPNS